MTQPVLGQLPGLLAWPAAAANTAPHALWTSDALAKATDGVASTRFAVSNIATDSREITEGGLFVAMHGEAMDGHRFIDTALERGASAAIVERRISQPHVLVGDSFAALQALGRAARARLEPEAVVIGVTGSVGKTSVKEALFAALDRASRGAAHRSVKSYNNHVGVPLSLARMPAQTRFGIFEMGMNHAGEIAGLAAQVRPHIALITAVAPAHIENLGSEEAIADAKAEIFLGLEPRGETPPTAIIPADSPHFARLKAAAEAVGAQVVCFGLAPHADVRLIDAVAAPGGGSLVTAQLGERRLCFTVAAAGDHWVVNALGVMAAVRAAGGDLGSAGLALAEMPGLAGRGARLHITADGGGRALIIDESYNANPASMRSTLATLARTPATRRIAVLGAMKELGDFGPGLHAALAEPISAANVDFALLVGAEMTALADELGKSTGGALGKPVAFAHCLSVEEANLRLAENGIKDGDAILVKGSNSVGLGALVAALAAK